MRNKEKKNQICLIRKKPGEKNQNCPIKKSGEKNVQRKTKSVQRGEKNAKRKEKRNVGPSLIDAEKKKSPRSLWSFVIKKRVGEKTGSLTRIKEDRKTRI